MQETTSASVLYIGVNLGLVESFSQKNKEPDHVRLAVDRAYAHAVLVPFLHVERETFEAIRRTYGRPEETERAAVAVRDLLFQRLEPNNRRLAVILNVGMRLGNCEAFAYLGVEKEWIVSDGLRQAKDLCREARLNTALIDWASMRQDSNDAEDSIQGVRRLLYDGFNERVPGKLRARCSRVELPIGRRPDTGTVQELRDPVYARALVLDDGVKRIALVSVDTKYVYGENYGDAQNDFSNVKRLVSPFITFDGMIVGATHTHHDTNPPVNDFQCAIAAAIINAAGDLQDVELGIQWGTATEGFNRVIRREDRLHTSEQFNECPQDRSEYLANHPLDPVDPTVGVIHLRRPGSFEPVATLVNYACHAVVLHHDFDKRISADYPGLVSSFVTRLLKDRGNCDSGNECFFFQSASGDIDPWCCLTLDPTADERMNQMAQSIGQVVIDSIGMIQTFSANLSVRVLEASTPLERFERLTNGLVAIKASSTIMVLGSEIALVSIPGELFTELGIDLKRRSSRPHTFVIGCANDAIGYIPPALDVGTGAWGTTPRNWCGLQRGDGEAIVEKALNALNNLQPQENSSFSDRAG